MSDDQQQANVALQQFQLNSQISAGASGGGGEAAPGNLLDTILRLFGINGHSTGGLDSILNIGGMWGGLSLQGKGLFGSQLDARGGIFAGITSSLGFTFGGNIHGGSAADRGTPADGGAAMAGGGGGGGAAGGGAASDSGGGDAQYASLNTIPSAAIQNTGIQNVQAQHVADAAPAPKASAVRASRASRSTRSEGGGESMGRG